MEGFGLMNTVITLVWYKFLSSKRIRKTNKRLESNERNPPRSNSLDVLNLLE